MKRVVWRATAGGFALGVAATFGVLMAVSSVPAAKASKPNKLGRDAFHRALDDVLDQYVEPVDEAVLLERGLKHMMAGLDPHSHYLSARERKALRKRARGGVSGLSVALRDGEQVGERHLEIVAVAPRSAAAAAGLAAGDHVLSIRGTEVERLLSQAEAEALLVGSVGERVEIAVQRVKDPKPADIALELGAAAGKSVDAKLVGVNGGKAAVFRIRNFHAGTGDAVKKSLASLKRSAGASGLRAVVIDLRSNPGGEVDEALVVADLFVAKGVLTRTRGRGGRILREENAHAAGTDTTTPLVVLQDRHSASAAELLAAALRDNGRATIVGERSYGKGTVQQVIGLDDGSVMALTIARYFSPNDRVIDGVGVSPDVEVAVDDDAAALKAGLDALGLSLTR
jgi:carboxyl-terminal processing protease